jgi:hypothetical protein
MQRRAFYWEKMPKKGEMAKGRNGEGEKGKRGKGEKENSNYGSRFPGLEN